MSFRPRLVFGLFFAIILAIPLAWRPILRAWGPAAESAPPSYLPALEAARPRQPFQPGPIEDLISMQPGYITIADSMGGRIDPERLTALANVPIAPILQNATGSAYWFLVFKNWVVASHVKPKRVVIFFRDTNLTDPMFRVSGPYRQTLDEVARDREDELNAVLAQHTNGLHGEDVVGEKVRGEAILDDLVLVDSHACFVNGETGKTFGIRRRGRRHRTHDAIDSSLVGARETAL